MVGGTHAAEAKCAECAQLWCALAAVVVARAPAGARQCRRGLGVDELHLCKQHVCVQLAAAQQHTSRCAGPAVDYCRTNLKF